MAVLARSSWLNLPVLAALFLLAPARARADDLQLYEQKIKAGLIYNFLKYTEWPAGRIPTAGGPIKVCIFGDGDPLGGYLDPIEERTVNRHPIKVAYVSEISETAGCHLLYISADEQDSWPLLRGYLANRNVLTVGDFRNFSSSGGMIQFTDSDSRVTVDLNLAAIAAGRLHISDSLRRISSTARSTGKVSP